MPAKTPVTIPVDDPTEAMPVNADVHVPPPATSLNVVVVPGHTEAVPEIGSGNESTTTPLVSIHPVLSEVNVIVAVPSAMPLMMPVPISAAAMIGSLLVQYPPTELSASVTIDPAQIWVGPVMAIGNG